DPIGGVWRTFAGLSTTYGTDRVRNTPISEQAIVGTAIGAALAGYRVVADIMFVDFIAVCLDQLANHAAKLRYMSGGVSGVPITVTTTVGSGRFGAQHTQSLEAWLMHTPGVKVVYPTTPEDDVHRRRRPLPVHPAQRHDVQEVAQGAVRRPAGGSGGGAAGGGRREAGR